MTNDNSNNNNDNHDCCPHHDTHHHDHPTDEAHLQGTFFIENGATSRRFTSWVPNNFTDTPLYLWPLVIFDPNYVHGHFDVEYTGKNQEYYIRNTPGATAPSPLYISHNAPSAPTLSVNRQTCRLIPASSPDVYFISTDTSHSNTPGVLTDQNAPQNLAGDLRPDVERLDRSDRRQMWVFKRI